MTGAAYFLVTRSIANAFKRSVGRLRQPRYLAGGVLVVFYFWTFLFRRGAMEPASRHALPIAMMTLIVTALALVILIVAWALPGGEPGLVFSEAEIQFFFAGPVSRRQLLAYKILRSQLQSFFSAIIFSFFAFRGSHLLGVWIGFVVMDVYLTFVSFVRARLALAGIGWIWRAVIVSIVLTAIVAIASRQFSANSDLITNALTIRQRDSVGLAIAKVASQPPLSTILFIPGLFASTVYGAHPFGPAAIIIAAGFALFFLTTQFDIAFEDASIVASQRAMTRRARMRGMRGGRSTAAVNRFPPPFRLADTGRPEVALIWKNLIGTFRISSFPIVALALPLFVAAIASIFHSKRGLVEAMGIMGLMSTAMFVFIGPQAVRTDLRTDILRLDLIKTFPLSAESLLIGELGASLIVVSAAEILMLIAGVTILQFGSRHFSFATTPEFVVSALVFIIPITAIQLLIQNGAIILFPAWNLGADGGRFSAMGQRMLFLLGNLVTLALSLIPAAILFLPSFWLAHRLFGSSPIGILAATIPAAGALVAEVFIGHKLLAAQFEEIDVANEV